MVGGERLLPKILG